MSCTVYKDDDSKDKDKDVHKRSYLYRDGRGFRYIHNSTIYVFPDYDTFLYMGFENCMTLLEAVPSKAVTDSLPIKELSKDILKSVYLLNLWGRTNCSHHNDSQDGFSYLSFPSVNANIQSLRSHAEPLQVMNFSRFMALVEVEALNVPGVKDSLLP